MKEMKNVIPAICIGSRSISDFDTAIRREWIVTNGLGGYASSTMLGINTRKYHGLLIASLNPPADRRILLAKLDEEIQCGDKIYSTGSNEFKQIIHPKGYRFLIDFSLAPFPTYRYDVQDIRLRKTIFMPYKRNVTVVNYEVHNPRRNETTIRVFPLVNCRHLYTVTNKDDLNWNFIQEPFDRGVSIQPSIPLPALLLFSSDGQYVAKEGGWVEKMYFRVDDSRGDSCLDDGYQPGFFEVHVAPKEFKKFYVLAVAGKDEDEAQKVLSSLYQENLSIDALYDLELRRRKHMLRRFQKQHPNMSMSDWLKWIVLAADSFIVDRMSTKTKTVIAGYHWFEDWGRDSLIALSGLTLVTGRFEDAKKILLTCKRYCHKGLIPNPFPEILGDELAYNTVDATLWFFHAVYQYLKYTNDLSFVRKELWNTLKTIFNYHVRGTLYGIHMDDHGLIAHGPQLTWMDAKIGNHAVTPREGKAVEIQALWYNALRIMETLSRVLDQNEGAEEYYLMAENVKESFLQKFWNPQQECLFDVIIDGKADASLRPNQIMAVALDFSMVKGAKEERIVEKVREELWGTYGLKTLSVDDPRHVGIYLGNWGHRDTAYHNGTVWAWLLGPFTTAFLRVKKYQKRWRTFAFETFLKPLFSEEVFQAGLGTISEIFDGDPPHTSRGCISQAWSVAEPLRAYVEDVLMQRPPYERSLKKNWVST